MGGGVPFHILFLCSNNTVQSIIAEALLNHFGNRNFRAYSAGIEPGDKIHDLTNHTLSKNGIPTDGLRAKPWQEYTLKNAPEMDGIILVSSQVDEGITKEFPNNPRGFICPLPNPARVMGSDNDLRAAFQVAFEITRVRIRWLMEVENHAPDHDGFFSKLEETPFFEPVP